MAMGLITFIFVMKRVNSTALYLCSASLLLFIAAILDLGQLLVRGPAGNSQGFDQDVVAGFVVAREVALGLSYGFLFLFVWRAVAECPREERLKSHVQKKISGLSQQPHSASWTRWGLLGGVLKWFMLALIIVIPLLQIVWRLVVGQRQYGSTYIADSTLEIVASAIFVLKIVLNVLVSPSQTWWVPFRSYSGLVFALIITGAMGVGNLISFAFSETVLGRFLRAISVYVLLLWNLISIFHRRNNPRRLPDDQEAAPISPGLEKPRALEAEVEDTGLAHLQGRTPSIITLERGAVSDSKEIGRPPLRVSTASRLSVIVNRVEQNETLAEITRSISSRSIHKSPVMPIAPKRPRRPDLRFDIITPSLPSTTENPVSPEEPPTTGISLSYYTMNTSTADIPIIREPPVNLAKASVYQQDSQENSENSSQVSLVAQPPSQDPIISSFNELMRQQNELDKSIAKLRLLSVDTTNLQSVDVSPATALESSSVAEDTLTSTRSRPPSTLLTESLSPHSEFSFSAFPLPPPPPDTIGLEHLVKRPIRRLRESPGPNPRQAAPMLSEPETPSRASMVARMVSGGTQYDVTSFIGNLTEPDEVVRLSAEQELSLISDKTTENESEAEQEASLPDSADNNRMSNLKPMILPAVASGRKIVPIPSVRPVRSGSQSSPHVGPRDSTIILRPFLLGTSTTSVPLPLPSSTMVPFGPRRGSRAARVPAHKSRISVPRLNISDPLDEEAPETYERPRPPPAVSGLPDRPKA
ncbi:hypothetical protein AN958_04900 [Leucoagaricus sp. SymC.cos]|nr:hypothetical protein AN958_04900 [Leucoagaricus sp. SymC.cos]